MKIFASDILVPAGANRVGGVTLFRQGWFFVETTLRGCLGLAHPFGHAKAINPSIPVHQLDSD